MPEAIPGRTDSEQVKGWDAASESSSRKAMRPVFLDINNIKSCGSPEVYNPAKKFQLPRFSTSFSQNTCKDPVFGSNSSFKD